MRKSAIALACPPGNIFRWRQLTPVGFADEDDPSGAQALPQKRDRAGDTSPDTGRHIDLLGGDIAGSIAVDEPDLLGDAEFFRPESRLLGKQLAQVDADADSYFSIPGLPAGYYVVIFQTPDGKWKVRSTNMSIGLVFLPVRPGEANDLGNLGISK